MAKSTHEMIESAEFKRLVRGKWTIAIVLTVLLFIAYYGFIFMMAVNKPFLAQKIGEHTTLGFPIAAGVIGIAWVLTAIYIVWANRVLDGEVSRLVADLKK
jgi:uncharacterized membrane protein (DUF485 family)